MLAMGKEQIEQTTLLQRINSVPSAVGEGDQAKGLSRSFPLTRTNESSGDLCP